MRNLYVVALLSVAACSSSAIAVVETEPDATAPLEEAGAEAAPAEAGPPCTPSLTAAPLPEACGDGGARYAVYGGKCPTGDVGACTVVRDDVNARYAEACCERVACTRAAAPGDYECGVYLDAGGYEGWSCPWAKGKQLAKAPGTCVLLGAPGPTAASTSGDYCCKP